MKIKPQSHVMLGWCMEVIKDATVSVYTILVRGTYPEGMRSSVGGQYQ